MFGGDFGLPPGPRYERRSTGGAPPVVYLKPYVTPSRLAARPVHSLYIRASSLFFSCCRAD